MASREPSWWYSASPAWPANLLTPAARLYGAAMVRRYRNTAPARAAHPVICVGNFTVGGTGKTPLSLALAKQLRSRHRPPWFLSRGYGGKLAGPVRVDPARHTAADVGDEPLLLARDAPTIVSRHRPAGAMLIASCAPADAVIIMDDGLQNPSLAKDVSIAVVDCRRGVGNGRVLPAGPLRAPLAFQMSLADVIVVTGDRETPLDPDFEAALSLFPGPMIRAHAIAAGDTTWLKSRRVIAYAGIANPQRFFTMLEQLDARIIATRVYGDHATYSERDASELLDAAKALDCDLVTTSKDLARLAGMPGATAELHARSKVFAITLSFSDDDLRQLMSLIMEKIGALAPRGSSIMP
ncbi:MAG: tetraacyldisaccharide 4'-kinase [Hyphomicrobium sp.]|nr:tetraacyldisaccharide 4'-kinase [Hyphomicrobium sp.]